MGRLIDIPLMLLRGSMGLVLRELRALLATPGVDEERVSALEEAIESLFVEVEHLNVRFAELAGATGAADGAPHEQIQALTRDLAALAGRVEAASAQPSAARRGAMGLLRRRERLGAPA